MALSRKRNVNKKLRVQSRRNKAAKKSVRSKSGRKTKSKRRQRGGVQCMSYSPATKSYEWVNGDCNVFYPDSGRLESGRCFQPLMDDKKTPSGDPFCNPGGWSS